MITATRIRIYPDAQQGIHMIKITVMDGHVSIDSDQFSYSNIRDMYGNGVPGVCIQTNKKPTEEFKAVNYCFELIAGNIYKLQDLLTRL